MGELQDNLTQCDLSYFKFYKMSELLLEHNQLFISLYTT